MNPIKIEVAGVQIDNLKKAEAIAKIDFFVRSEAAHYVVTPYSEMIVFAQSDFAYRNILNQADLSLPDGIGVLWAAKFLSLPKSNWLMELLRLKLTLLAIIFNKKYIRSVISEQITGSQFIYDLASLAQEKNYSVALVGGAGNVAVQASHELKKIFPNLRINLALSGTPFNSQTVNQIAQSNSDILLIAYSPPMQETWIAQNLSNLHVKVAMGLGGTLDYLAGKRAPAPNFARSWGLEWLWRLITQPWRFRRIWNAVPVFVWKIYRYKIKNLK